jgi:hypothetical protein
MKKLTCMLAALAMVMLTHIPAQAEFLGTLQRDQTWSLEVDNSNNALAAGVTIFYLGGKNVDYDIHTAPPAELVTFTISRMPRGTTRVIIELDPGRGLQCPVRLIQGGPRSRALASKADW